MCALPIFGQSLSTTLSQAGGSMLRLPEAGRLACGGVRMCVSLRETVGDMDVDDEATWTYSRRVSRRDTHIRCAPSRKRGTRLRAQGALLRGYSTIVMTPQATRPPALPVGWLV